MKSNSKVMSIVSLVLTVVLAIVGTVLFFVAGFNQTTGKEETLTVSYGSYVLLNEDAEKAIIKHLNDEFPGAIVQNASSTTEGQFTVSGAGVGAKVSAVESYLKTTYPDGAFVVASHKADIEGSVTYVWRAAIVAGAIIVVAFVYTAIRYRLYAGLASLIGSVSTAAIVLALGIITRMPVGEFLATVLVAALALYEVFAILFLSNAKAQFPAMEGVSAEEAVKAVSKEVRKEQIIVLIFAACALVTLVWSGIFPILMAAIAVASVAFTALVMFPALLALLKAPVDAKDEAKKAYDYKEE